MDTKTHWEKVYTTKAPEAVSCVPQELWRLRLEHLAANVGSALGVGPCTDPVHQTAGLQIGFQFSPHKDDAVGFGGDEALPYFIWGCDVA
jgi:hypothetical protein